MHEPELIDGFSILDRPANKRKKVRCFGHQHIGSRKQGGPNYRFGNRQATGKETIVVTSNLHLYNQLT